MEQNATLVIKMKEILQPSIKVLLVNRQDTPETTRNLESLFGWKIQCYSLGDATGTKKVTAATDAIRAGRYSMVLGTTGFFGHKHDHMLAQAAQAAKTPYVRVNRGGLGNIILAVARSLGLQ